MRSELKTTTHRRTYKILWRKEIDPWGDGLRYDQQGYFHWKTETREKKKNPNWKLCTKNRKQWMPKKLIKEINLYQNEWRTRYLIDYNITW